MSNNKPTFLFCLAPNRRFLECPRPSPEKKEVASFEFESGLVCNLPFSCLPWCFSFSLDQPIEELDRKCHLNAQPLHQTSSDLISNLWHQISFSKESKEIRIDPREALPFPSFSSIHFIGLYEWNSNNNESNFEVFVSINLEGFFLVSLQLVSTIY